MKRLVVLVLVVAALGGTSLQGCGDDATDEAEADGGQAGKAGSGGGGGAGVRAGPGPSGGGGAPAGDVKCGSTTCTAPGGGALGGLAMACCADPATSTCGMSLMGAACSKPVPDDPRCPGLQVMGFIMLPSCCTPDDKCGIDASMFGMPGCVDLKSAAERSSMMGGSGTMIPAPRACSDADGGAADASM